MTACETKRRTKTLTAARVSGKIRISRRQGEADIMVKCGHVLAAQLAPLQRDGLGTSRREVAALLPSQTRVARSRPCRISRRWRLLEELDL